MRSDNNEDEWSSRQQGPQRSSVYRRAENNVYTVAEDAGPAYPLSMWHEGDEEMNSLHWRGVNTFRKEAQ